MVFRLLIIGAMMLSETARSGEPTRDPKTDCWVIEQMPGGTTRIEHDEIQIRDRGGCTVWFHDQLHAPVEISYEAMVVNDGEPDERVSDLNCFWMASDLASPDELFDVSRVRTGEFKSYDKLATYYVGYGGNNNTTTRFRRYEGTGARPLLPEHDLSDRKFLLEPNRWYRITLVARDGMAKFIRDDETVFELHDEKFLSSGWFGIRTVASHLRVRNIRVVSAGQCLRCDRATPCLEFSAGANDKRGTGGVESARGNCETRR